MKSLALLYNLEWIACKSVAAVVAAQILLLLPYDFTEHIVIGGVPRNAFSAKHKLNQKMTYLQLL